MAKRLLACALLLAGLATTAANGDDGTVTGSCPAEAESAIVGASATPSKQGYALTSAIAVVSQFGDQQCFGGLEGIEPNAPMTHVEATGDGYWLVGLDGGVYTKGAARFHGSAGGLALNSPVVGMDAVPDQSGYRLAAADGGVFAYNASFHGSMSGVPLQAPVVGIASSPDGYWLAAADGAVFAFGDAPYHGNARGVPLAAPIVAVIGAADGYWLVAEDGGVFAFGQARFHGSLAGTPLAAPIVAAAAANDGYWLFGQDGGVFAFGDAGFFGSAA